MRRRRKTIRLSLKMMTLLLSVFSLIFILIIALFYQTNVSMMNKSVEILGYNASNITKSLDEMVSNVFNTSETFSTNADIDRFVDKSYVEGSIEKRHAVTYILNRVFAEFSALKKDEQIAAIYTHKKEIINLTDKEYQSDAIKDKLDLLNIDGKEKLSVLSWYTLQDNFLIENKTGDIRRDKAVFASRKIYSRAKGIYNYVQIFALPEEYIYEKYSTIAEQLNAEIYIINGKGRLISSSNLYALEQEAVDVEILDLVYGREENSFVWKKDYIVSVSKSGVNDWITVLIAPLSSITVDINHLYFQIILIITFCIILSCVLLLYMYRSFMQPISKMNNAMERVYNGDFDAYVDSRGTNEIDYMIEYYNAMLKSINVNIKERLALEQKKRELEAEVLMAQINPHFLYNTLETIVWKSSAAGRSDIGRIAASLGHLYRLSISNGDLVVKLKQELEHLTSYINIQKSRYEDNFEFISYVDYDEIREFYILKLLLQPIVENSFLYGMVGLERKMRIILRIEVYDAFIKIRIIDNGMGMSQDNLATLRQHIATGEKAKNKKRNSTGIGLYSVSERLKLYFGLTDVLKIYSKEGVGTVTTIKIPKITTDEMNRSNR